MKTSERSTLVALKPTFPEGSVPDGGKRRMLQAALKLFAVEGFHGTSVRDLVKVLELQPSTLYSHYPSKEHLLAALLEVGHAAHHALLQQALVNADDGSAARLAEVVKAHSRFHAMHGLLAVVVNEELYTVPPELGAPALALRNASTDIFVGVIERGVETGDFVVPKFPGSVGTIAAAIGAMGMRVPYWFQGAAGLDVEGLAETHAELALRMVGAKR